MKHTKQLLDTLAEKQGALISDLRLQPKLRRKAILQMYRISDKRKFPLSDWEEAVSYLTETQISFNTYDEVCMVLNLLCRIEKVHPRKECV